MWRKLLWVSYLECVFVSVHITHFNYSNGMTGFRFTRCFEFHALCFTYLHYKSYAGTIRFQHNCNLFDDSQIYNTLMAKLLANICFNTIYASEFCVNLILNSKREESESKRGRVWVKTVDGPWIFESIEAKRDDYLFLFSIIIILSLQPIKRCLPSADTRFKSVLKRRKQNKIWLQLWMLRRAHLAWFQCSFTAHVLPTILHTEASSNPSIPVGCIQIALMPIDC